MGGPRILLFFMLKKSHHACTNIVILGYPKEFKRTMFCMMICLETYHDLAINYKSWFVMTKPIKHALALKARLHLMAMGSFSHKGS